LTGSYEPPLWRSIRPLCPISSSQLKALYDPPADQQQQPAADADAQQQVQGDEAAGVWAAASSQPPPAAPPPAAALSVTCGYPHLTVLDLTGSCVAPGLVINIEALQVACPNLEELSFEGVGALYGGFTISNAALQFSNDV
jgi:hypothetical protein